MSFRLAAVDLDGTLLNSAKVLSPRTAAAIAACEAAGIRVVPATGRQLHGLLAITDPAGLLGLAVCANGAVGAELGTRRILFEEMLAAEVQLMLAEAMRAVLPDVRCASVRDGGMTFVPEFGYARLCKFAEHMRDPATMTEYPLDEVVAEPAAKFVVRHPTLSGEEVLAVLDTLELTGFNVTTSGAPFIEVMAPGVTKAAGLARLCADLGIAADEVIAFGDSRNDIEMLDWAGHGVAMADAMPEVLAVADQVTLGNNEDGVAVVLERLVAGP